MELGGGNNDEPPVAIIRFFGHTSRIPLPSSGQVFLLRVDAVREC